VALGPQSVSRWLLTLTYELLGEII
jgi:hypothetical protein